MATAPVTPARRHNGPGRRAVHRLLVGALGGLGALAALLGAGLSLVGLCCAGLAAAGAGTAATGAAVPGPWAWLFLAVGTILIAAAFTVRHRRTPGRGCCPPITPDPTRASSTSSVAAPAGPASVGTRARRPR